MKRSNKTSNTRKSKRASTRTVSAVGFDLRDGATVNIHGNVNIQAGAIVPDKPSDKKKRRAGNGNKVAAKRKIEDKNEKVKKRKKTTGKSLPKNFEKKSKLNLIKIEHTESTKPHLLQTVEFEVYDGCHRKAGAALRKALVHKGSVRASSEELLTLTNQCTNCKDPLKAVLFYFFTAVKMKAAETAKNGTDYFLLSKQIYDLWLLLKNNGVHCKQVAKFVPSLMSQIYDLGFDKASAKCRSYALSWIAVAYSHIEDYENAFGFGKKGLKIMNAEFPRITERRKEQSYSRLLECTGLGYEHWTGQLPAALKSLKASVVARRMAECNDNGKRETAISIRSRHVQRVQKKIHHNAKRNKNVLLRH